MSALHPEPLSLLRYTAFAESTLFCSLDQLLRLQIRCWIVVLPGFASHLRISTMYLPALPNYLGDKLQPHHHSPRAYSPEFLSFRR